MATKRLNRHEELRYDYLLKNLEYLSERERDEFDYLYQKKRYLEQSDITYSSSPSSPSAYDELSPVYEEEAQEEMLVQDLPKYPSNNWRSSRPNNPVEEWSEPEEIPRPKRLKKNKVKKRKKRLPIKRIFQALGVILLCVFGGMVYMFYRGVKDVTSGQTDYTAAATEVFNGEDTDNGTNILILGSDQRITQGSSDARTDTIMVMNIGNSDGDVKLVSFMRDTLVNIPDVSASDYDYDQKLNVAFNIGEQNDNQGAELMRETLKHNFDIDIKYYVMVDFETFAEAIDTLFPDGVEIDAQFGTIDGEEVTTVDVPSTTNADITHAISEGVQKMDGETLLDYARFRKDDDGDYGRTTRQQQVIAAVISQIKDPSKLFTGSAAIGKIYALTSTNISYTFLLSQGLSVITNGQESIHQETIPSEGDWIDAYDMYGGLGLLIDFDTYQERLSELGFR